jgi:hypothetical protein
MPEPVKPPDSTPKAPARPVAPAPAKVDPVALAEAHLRKVDMAKQRAILKQLT